ncbi:MAG: hypothetical protein ISN28_03050, partial [Ectothiorhodospiraceae bacterium AqS1]|nr:hypothetical protein [Ectothiorhodospiraceae bacterium AqS1]
MANLQASASKRPSSEWTFADPIELVARSFDVSAADVSRWLKKADYAVEGALKDGEGDGKDLQIKELQSKVGELTMLLELERRKDRKIGGRPPFGALRGQGDEFRRYGPSEKKPYGVDRPTVWTALRCGPPYGVDRPTVWTALRCGRCGPPYGVERVRKGWRTSATVYRRMKEASRTSDDQPPRPRGRPGPDGPMPDAQIDAIEQVEWMSFGDSPFHGEGYRKVRASSAHRRRGFCGSCER